MCFILRRYWQKLGEPWEGLGGSVMTFKVVVVEGLGECSMET